MFWIEFIVLMLIIVWGTRKGGSFLAMAGGIGMLIFVYIFRVTPSDPPITVILIMLAVITAACTMQATGGLDFMVQLAEKILRKRPGWSQSRNPRAIRPDRPCPWSGSAG